MRCACLAYGIHPPRFLDYLDGSLPAVHQGQAVGKVVRLIRELNDAGYRGPLSVEWEDNGMDREFGAAESRTFVASINFAPSSIAFDRDMKSR